MKQGLLTVATILVAVVVTFAQQRGGRGFGNPEENAKQNAERLEKELKLSSVQKDSVYAYSLAQSKAMQQAFQGGNGDRQQMMGKMRELREQTDKKILTVLDDNQKKAYEKLVKERANRQGPPGGGQRRGRD